MPAQTYSFRVRERSGQVSTGSLVAESAAQVGARLRAEGKTILAISDKPLAASLNADQIKRSEAARRVNREDVIAFCQQLSVMLDTGVPLAEALDSFSKQTRCTHFRQVLSVLSNDIQGGESLSSSMGRWPRVFPPIMLSLIKASEASGSMGLMLGRIGEYLSKERRTARQIKGAVTYPLFMIFMAVGLSLFLLTFVLPKFASIYASRAASLPIPTRILLTFSEFLTSQYLIYGPILGTIVLGTLFWRTRPSGRKFFDWLRLRTPIIREMYCQLYITRSMRTMATLLAGGVNLLDIIEICRGITNNHYFGMLWTSIEDGVRQGQQMSESLYQSPFIPANVASMVNSGERSGRLAEVMQKIADFAEEELDASVKQATAYIEPAMIVIMGGIIGAVAIALLLPILTMGRMVSGG